MTMNFSMNSVFHVFRRLNGTTRVYMGTVQARDAAGAAIAAMERFGSGARYAISLYRNSRVIHYV